MGLKTTVRNIKKAIRFYSLENKRKKLIAELANKDKIKVAFLGYALGGSSDVFSGLYKLFAADSRFEPYVVIVPNSHGEKSAMIEMQNQAKEYLDKLGIPYICGYDVDSDSYVDIAKTINPDVVFMCHHYDWFPREFRIENFMDKISYIFQYSLLLVNNITSHCTCRMHDFGHKVFYYPGILSKYIKKKYKYRRNICNVFLGEMKLDALDNISKTKTLSHDNLKQIIWAPHHYDGPFSNFLECADLFVHLAEKYKDKVKFIFRPHPGLKYSLLNEGIWDSKKIDDYWNLWQKIGTVSSGDFIDVFDKSDAMILDSISFLGEYAYINKPALFINKKNQKMGFNVFGQKIKEISYNCDTLDEIEKFIQNVVISGKDILKEQREQFIKSEMLPPNNKSAAANIFDYVIKDLNMKRSAK